MRVDLRTYKVLIISEGDCESVIIPMKSAPGVDVLIKDNHMIVSGRDCGTMCIEMGRGIIRELLEIEAVYAKRT